MSQLSCQQVGTICQTDEAGFFRVVLAAAAEAGDVILDRSQAWGIGASELMKKTELGCWTVGCKAIKGSDLFKPGDRLIYDEACK